MKITGLNKFQLLAIPFIAIMVLNSCATNIELTSSWTSKTAKTKEKPLVMVMVIGKNVANRKAIENDLVAKLKKRGNNAVAALDIFKPEIQKYDSVSMVNLLRQNKIDMLLTNAIVKVTKNERYIPGTSKEVSAGPYVTPYNPSYSSYGGYNGVYIGNYGNYYGYYNNYEMPTEKRFEPGYTITDVVVLIESNLFNVDTPELIWYGQSKTFTTEPSEELFKEFTKIIVSNIAKKHKLLK